MNSNIMLFFVVVLIVISSASCGLDTNTKVVSDIPKEQAEFQEARNSFYQAYDAALNEIKKSDVFNDSRAHTCSFKNQYGDTFTDWTGVVADISTDQGGDEILKFSIESDEQGVSVSYQQMGIKRGSPLYKQIAEFAIGQKVYFTFSFEDEAFSTNVKECFDEASLTELGSLREPEFRVTFKSIR
jgi:hypothetical protein